MSSFFLVEAALQPTNAGTSRRRLAIRFPMRARFHREDGKGLAAFRMARSGEAMNDAIPVPEPLEIRDPSRRCPPFFEDCRGQSTVSTLPCCKQALTMACCKVCVPRAAGNSTWAATCAPIPYWQPLFRDVETTPCQNRLNCCLLVRYKLPASSGRSSRGSSNA